VNQLSVASGQLSVQEICYDEFGTTVDSSGKKLVHLHTLYMFYI